MLEMYEYKAWLDGYLESRDGQSLEDRNYLRIYDKLISSLPTSIVVKITKHQCSCCANSVAPEGTVKNVHSFATVEPQSPQFAGKKP
jgi:hypothetical protein